MLVYPSTGLRGVGSEEFSIKAPELRLLALTVATDETDGYKRFMKSAKANNIDVKVFNYSCKMSHLLRCCHSCYRPCLGVNWLSYD